MSQPEKPVCKVCMRIRWFMAIAIPLVVLIGANADSPLPYIPLHEIITVVISVGLVLVLSWRIYEYKQDQRAMARLKELGDKEDL